MPRRADDASLGGDARTHERDQRLTRLKHRRLFAAHEQEPQSRIRGDIHDEILDAEVGGVQPAGDRDTGQRRNLQIELFVGKRADRYRSGRFADRVRAGHDWPLGRG